MSNIINRIDEAIGSKIMKRNSPLDIRETIESKVEDITFSIEDLIDMREVDPNKKNKLRKVIKDLRNIEKEILKDI